MPAVRGGRESKNDAISCATASVGRTIEVTGRVRDDASIGRTTIRPAGEHVQHTLSPGSIWVRREFEHDATAHVGAPYSTALGHAVEIAGGVEDHPEGTPAIPSALEIVECAFSRASVRVNRQLEHRTISISAAIPCGAVEISGFVEGERIVGTSAVGACKAVEYALLPGPISVGRQLEDGAQASIRPTLLGGAVEIAGGVEDYPATGLGTVRPVKAEKHALLPSPVCRGRQFEHDTPVRRSAAPLRRPVEIASGVQDQRANRAASVWESLETVKCALRPSPIVVRR